MKNILKISTIVGMLVVNSFADSSIYIWSKAFASTPNSEIIMTLKKNNIDTAIISFKKNQSSKFIDIEDKGIKAIPLISNNNYVYPKNRYKLDRKIKYLSLFSREIHLDIEPHALKELKHHRTEYFKMYINMLKYLKNKYPSIKFDISVPAFYYKIPHLREYVNKIYVMAYENPKSLIKRISRFPTNSYIAQNCKEFNSKNSLNNIINLIRENNYDNIAYHSWRTCKKFLKF